MTSNLMKILASIHSFQDYEQFKQQVNVLEKLAQEIIDRHKITESTLQLFSEGTNIVFLYGDHVIKIFPPFHADQFNSESLVLKHLESKLTAKTPALEYSGEIVDWPYIIMTKLDGILLETLWETLDEKNKKIIISELGSLIKEVHALPTHGLETIDCHWQNFIDRQMNYCVKQHRITQLPVFLLLQIPGYLESIQFSLKKIKKPVLLTGEYTPMNLLVKQISGNWHIDGLFDFGDAMLGLPEYDLLGPGAFLIQGNKKLLKNFLIEYGYSVNQMTTALSQKLTGLMLLHKYSNLKIQIRIKDWQNQINHIQDLENLVWGF